MFLTLILYLLLCNIIEALFNVENTQYNFYYNIWIYLTNICIMIDLWITEATNILHTKTYRIAADRIPMKTSIIAPYVPL